MKKWTTISLVDEEFRWSALSESLREKGAENEFSKWPGNLESLSGVQDFEGYDHIRLSTQISAQVVKHVKVQSSWTTLLGVVDGMNKTPYGWWPLCALYESFGQLLIGLGQDLDTRGNVLVAGAGGSACIAIAAFFKAGFRDFIITNFDEAAATKLIREVKSKFFGLTVTWVPVEKIVLLPGESSVLLNCTPPEDESDLLKELSYLNFLKRPGFLFDLGRSSKPSILVQEAEDAGVQSVSGIEIAARTDVLWAKWGFNVDLDLNIYTEKLKAGLG